MGQRLFIKNMVCDRCIMVVKAELLELGLRPKEVELGVIELEEDTLSDAQLEAARDKLQAVGFELLEGRKSQIVEAIKTAVIELVHKLNDETRLKHSEYIAKKLNYDYAYLSKLFSEEEKITIEQYTIQQKIERVKELLTYDELTLSQIAFQMGYSSVAALSGQFKKVMGISPSEWKRKDQYDRRTLDKVARG